MHLEKSTFMIVKTALAISQSKLAIHSISIVVYSKFFEESLEMILKLVLSVNASSKKLILLKII